MKTAFWAASIATISLICGTAMSDEITIPLNDTNCGDNFLYNNGPTTNFGPNGIYYYDNRGSALDKARPIIRFDLATLPECSTITSVQYQLWLVDYTFIDMANGGAVVPWPFSIYPMRVDWSENGSNWLERMPGVPWSTPGMAAGVDYDATAVSTLVVSTPGNRYISWDITSLYNDWVSGARPNYGFHLHGPTGNPNLTTSSGDTTDGVFRCNSSEYADDFRRPHLVITYTPGPCPCPADFNRDGGVDGGDVEAFFLAWEAGDASTDVNSDGGVDGADVEVFFIAWEAGGC
ncbi:MAG: DNRLRE domain-containing protein [Planctomycetes bacterium]|nr:DNRLRE domain-containing protein [Planctomycetota bacterium]